MTNNQHKICIAVIISTLSLLPLFAVTGQKLAEQKISKKVLRKYFDYKRRAALFYEESDYQKGLKLYEKAYNLSLEDDTILFELARGYYFANQPEKSFSIYRDIIKENMVAEDIHYVVYADVLVSKGYISYARKWLELYKDRHEDAVYIKEKIEGLNRSISFYKDSSRYDVRHAVFNTDGYDFSPAYYQDRLVFVSSRRIEGSIDFLQPKNKRDKTNYLNLFLVDTLGDVQVFDKGLKTSYHEGPMVFYDNDTKLIFTRNSFQKNQLSAGERNNLKLFYTHKIENGDWQEPKELWFNNDKYSCGHPAISSDGNLMFFSSNMPGGLGQADLYYTRLVNGEWSKPINLGTPFNTEGNEMFPFLSDSTLYFASDGLAGLGGFDMYMVNLRSSRPWPKNMGYPLNSTKDDFGLILEDLGCQQQGYFSSNRPDGLGFDDIYSFTYQIKTELVGKVIDDQTGQSMQGVTVKLLNKFDGSEQFMITDDSGNFRFLCALDDLYEVVAIRSGYASDRLLVDPLELRSLDLIRLRLSTQNP